MFLLAQTDTSGPMLFTGIFGWLVAFLTLFVAIVWIIFPFLVNSKFNTLIREMRNLRAELKTRRDEDKAGKPAATPKIAGDTPAATAAGPAVYRID
jgi:hypothetical protein